METEYMNVEICDIRGQEERADLETCGFQIRKLRSAMTYEQFGNPACVEEVYLRDLRQLLLKEFGAAVVHFERTRIRRRHPDFPKSTGTVYDHHQPSTAAHVGASSIWKPLRGPLQDWPLAICDARSVDATSDMIEATILYPDRMNHNFQVHFNARHRWFFLGGQCDDELLIFRQYDSRLGDNSGVPHSSFPDPNTPQHAFLRESIEVVACLCF
ncbi:hypothetical protein M409DRAFT_70334 [Zasmidium cellare ATCC 36951]|uniref:Uncharacterized protein n=1 Tax=Zasmidium cellare ATCC 36951 TaxID=1080233 RepID=A0A6A6C2S3_ZASCE|nr:uncharacterized protein M409DRAFT_70334 [Zasmidium cellare ATCC 36951]KAF2160588.1 hypothetical protein M409DRAFT_70334 [Zasmidium cellare ATCC 36951]